MRGVSLSPKFYYRNINVDFWTQLASFVLTSGKRIKDRSHKRPAKRTLQ